MMPLISVILSLKVSKFDQQKVVRPTFALFRRQREATRFYDIIYPLICPHSENQLVIFGGIQKHARKFHGQTDRLICRDCAAVNKLQYEKIFKGMEGNVCKLETSVFIISIVFPGAVPFILQLTANDPQSIKDKHSFFKFHTMRFCNRWRLMIFLNFIFYIHSSS